MADHDIYNYFSSYVLSQDQLRQLGFPQESSLHPGKAYIYKDPEFSLTQQMVLVMKMEMIVTLVINVLMSMPSHSYQPITTITNCDGMTALTVTPVEQI